MKIKPECAPCLLKRIIFETEQSTQDKKRRTQAVQKACKILSELYDPNKGSAPIATAVHKIVYETLQDKDPYKKLKQESNRVATSLIPKVEHLISQSKTPLKTAMICSIVGNTMDFGIDGSSTHPKMLSETFEKNMQEDLGYDDYKKAEQLLKNAHHVILFTDNCGEIVFDKILCRELKKFNNNIFLTVVVKGEPIISDATMDDAKEIKLQEVADEILTTGCFAIGVDFTKLPKDAENRLQHADVIICKGMANYEAFSETPYKPILYLLRTKCSAIATSMKIPLNKNVIKVYT